MANEPQKWAGLLGSGADVNTIPEETPAGTGAASMKSIFPPITQVPLNAGGIAPDRADFNGLFKLLGDNIYYQQQGGVYSYSATIDYEKGSQVKHNDKIYVATQANGPTTIEKEPGEDPDFWQEAVLSNTGIIATGTTTARSLENRFADVVNVKDFGAKGDGVTDDTAAIQSAVNTGKSIFLPNGTYILSGPINVPMGCNIYGFGEKTILKCISRNGFRTGVFIPTNGNISEDVAYLTADAVLGATTVTVNSTSSLSVGDTILIVSQRNALSTDGAFWQLGYATESMHAIYYAEPVRIQSISGNTISFTPGLVFPNYKSSRASERNQYARERSTIRKMNLATGVVIKDLCVDFTSQTDYTNASFIIVNKCKDVLIEGVKVLHGRTLGVLATFENSMNCTMKSCVSITSNVNPSSIDTIFSHYAMNRYKVISSWNTVLDDCISEGGTQPFDISYSDYGYPSLYTTVINCKTYNAFYNSMTSHGGTYGDSFIDNECIGCWRAGISIRSPFTLCQGNTISGAGAGTAYGIFLSRTTQQTVISNNKISGFNHGVRSDGSMLANVTLNNFDNMRGLCVLLQDDDSTAHAGVPQESKVTVHNNVFGQCASYGVRTIGIQQATIDNNAFYNYDHTCVYIDSSSGITISNNKFYKYTGESYAILGANASCNVYNNIDVKEHTEGYSRCSFSVGHRENVERPHMPGASLEVYAPTGGANNSNFIQFLTGSASNRGIIFSTSDVNLVGAYIYNGTEDRIDIRVSNAPYMYWYSDRLLPHRSNYVSLGGADNKWKEIYASNDVIQTSDERQKTEITDPKDALMKAWGKVNFKVFKFKDAIENKGENARKHIGVIAQDVQKAFESEGLNASDYGLFCYDEWADKYEKDEEGNETLIQKAGNAYAIRYTEALALECAYQRWLGAKREARIKALEAKLK